jgi:energy-coupling factor transport system ATP-binding protein
MHLSHGVQSVKNDPNQTVTKSFMTADHFSLSGNSKTQDRQLDRIQVESLNFTYAGTSTPALSDICLRIGPGEFVALAGANNSGKSSLCLALTGVIPHLLTGVMRGRIFVCGHDAAALKVAEMGNHIAMVMPKPEQQLSGVRFTVREEVAFGLENRGVERSEMFHRVNAALRMTGLETLADHSPHHLSGGQLQRVALAAAVASDCPVLVLDEPTSFLDPEGEKTMLTMLRRLCDSGHTVVLAGQRMDVMAEHADRVIALHEGRLVMDGTPQEVLTSARMKDIGLDWPRCAKVAALAQKNGLWDCAHSWDEARERSLPITPAETLKGLRTASRQNTTPSRPKDSVSFAYETREKNGANILLENVCFRYKTGPEVLKGITLRLGGVGQDGRGEAIALLGRNGSGKSTLVRHFNGLLKPAHGVVRVNGVPTTERTVAQLARNVALLFQNPDDQICKGTVLDEVTFGPGNLGFAREKALNMAQGTLAAMGLDGTQQRNPYDLGPSERKRLAIASVLAMDTDIVVLDEPTAGLDPAETALLQAVIRQLTATGKTVIVISHDMDFVAENLNRAICLEAGKVCYDGPMADLFDDAFILELCCLIPPQIAQLAAACDVTPKTITPRGLIDCLLRSRTSRQTHQSAASETRHD